MKHSKTVIDLILYTPLLAIAIMIMLDAKNLVLNSTSACFFLILAIAVYFIRKWLYNIVEKKYAKENAPNYKSINRITPIDSNSSTGS